MKSINRHLNLPILICTSLLTIYANGQDLGSSNKLFGNPKTNSTAKPSVAKKIPVRPKTVAAKPRSSVRTTSRIASHPLPKKPRVEIKPTLNKPDNDNMAAVRPSARPVETETIERYEQLIGKGNTARDDREYMASEAAYNQAKAVMPKDSRALFGLGNLYADQQRWEEAEKTYRAAIPLDPNDPWLLVALSYVLTQPVAAPNLSDRYEEAEKLARRALRLESKSPLPSDQLGVALELRGLIGEETEAAYRRAIAMDAGFAPAYAHLGRLLRRRGKNGESAIQYSYAIAKANDIPTLIVVADVMQSEQRYAESVPLLNQALADDPKNPTALNLLGRALTATGDFDGAERALRKSLDVGTNRFIPLSLIGAMYLRQANFVAADNTLMQAIKYVSGYEKQRLASQFEAVGDGYSKNGKLHEAQRSYRQAISLAPGRETLAAKIAVVK